MIPVYQPSLTGNEKKYVNDCLDTTWISSKGKYVQKFEAEFAKYVGVKHGALVSNGTVALHLALLALGIGPGDEVIVPTFTYIASVNAIRYVGATPVFIDSLMDTWQMDPAQFEKKITNKTRAVIVVHLYGHPCDMDRIMQIAREHDIFVIEDTAEAIGSRYKDAVVGSIGDIACFSFFGNKTITTGEGGMVMTNDSTLYDRVCRIRNQGNAPDREYWNDILGYNFRGTNIMAAIGLAQLEQIDAFIARKLEIGEMYKQSFASLPIKTHEPVGDVYHTKWMCSVLVEEPEERNALRAFLKEKGIETRPTFHPAHTMPMYSEKFDRYPVAEYIGWRGINLPSWPGLTDEQVQYICDCVHEFYKTYSK